MMLGNKQLINTMIMLMIGLLGLLIGCATEDSDDGTTSVEAIPTEATDPFEMGRQLVEAGQLQEAMQQFEVALEAAGDSAEQQALIHNQIGSLHLMQAQLPEAMSHFELAKRAAQTSNNQFATAEATIGIATVHLREDQPALAIDLYQQALRMLEGHNDETQLAKAYVGIGEAWLAQQSFDKAQSNLEQALAVLPADDPQQAVVMKATGDAYAGQGIYGQANDYYGRALALYRQLEDTHQETQLLLKSGAAFAAQTIYPLAQEQYELALTGAEKIGNERLQAESLFGLARVAHATGEFQLATEHYESALAIAVATADRLMEAQLLYEFGRMQTESAEFATASTTLAQALAAAQAAGATTLATDIEAAIAYLPTGEYDVNLIVNSGNEMPAENNEIPGWFVLEGNGWVQGNEVPVHAGSAYFDAALEDVFGELCQLVDVTGYAARIDQVTQQFTLNLFVRSYPAQWFTPADAAEVAWHYLAEPDAFPIERHSTQEYIVTDRWLEVDQQLTPPAQTRYIQLCLRSIKYGGFDSDGFFDEVSLVALPPQ